jgi:hypothetical protein
MAVSQIDFNSALSALERWGASREWIGPDPYEGLNSPLGARAPGKRARQAVTQLYKQLPVEPPWPLRARSRPNAKALALALSGYATSAGSELPGAATFLERIPSILERMNLLGQGAGWGYHFDVQTRNIRYDRRTPNAIATCFVVEGLVDAHAATGKEDLAKLALAARSFLLSLRRRGGHGPFFAYVPSGSPLVHNANLLVCGALARLHAIDPHERAMEAVEEAIGTTLSLQRDDGLWPYGEAPNYGWSDNFHTAYTLDGLARARTIFGIGGDELARGLVTWRQRFFDSSGWARYYPDRRFPLETHCCASAIDLLASDALPPDPENARLADRIAEIAIRELWLEHSRRFAFRRTARGLNTREFMRWTNAPMFRALARLESARRTTAAHESSSTA